MHNIFFVIQYRYILNTKGNTMPQINKILPSYRDKIVLQRMHVLKKQINAACLRGDCKSFKQAQEQFAQLAVHNFYLAKNFQAPKIKASLFSKQGLNMLKVMIYNIFRPRTTDEKNLYHKMRYLNKRNFLI